MSLLSARSGVMYSMLIPGFRFPIIRNRSITGSIAASVFPVAVADMRRTFFPWRMRGMILRCGSVGSVNPRSSNNLRTGRQRRLNTLSSTKADHLDEAWIKTISNTEQELMKMALILIALPGNIISPDKTTFSYGSQA